MPENNTRTTKGFITLYLKGLAMGAADVVPGVSGGTIAFISGIYEELMKIGGVSKEDFSLKPFNNPNYD